MDEYNQSLSFDRVFYAQDIKGSIAYARANVKTGVLTQEEFEKIEEGLKKVLAEWEEDKFEPAPGDEGEPMSLLANCIFVSPVFNKMPLCCCRNHSHRYQI